MRSRFKDVLTSPDIFPIYGVLSADATESQVWMDLLRNTARGILEFVVRNPYGLLAHSPERQRAMARVVRSAFPEVEQLHQEMLRLQALDKSEGETRVSFEQGAGLWLKQTLEMATPLRLSAEQAQDWFPLALPVGFKAFYILLETNRALSPRLCEFLESHARLWQPRAVYVKILEKRSEPPRRKHSLCPFRGKPD